ncbi:DUF4251 domain-containing protein [Dysgonomonas sp. Marseille-P4361]|uniref:DUF4251 domain-containing protein n=1 Tax=Dysgonomonas sp. Marseille-P4361 TaxID=2161820 RepID=UPI000D558574|nr:DUF4251 domain-containing protein [Dysgonomonas sp. Marseille-P4361]
MRNIFIFTLFSFFLFSCKTSDGLSKEQKIAQMTEKIEGQAYIFNAQKALPLAGRSVDINYSYQLKVSKDTISAYLPYFGRAYTAPISNDDAGVKFTSTDFEYSLSPEKNGTWNIKIKINDSQSKYRLFLKIGNSGKATLNVQDNRRQSISYYGQIE